ncbi:reverse transcriptase domain-containing protein [Tanacetum coccineum]
MPYVNFRVSVRIICLCNDPGLLSQGCMMAIFHDMIEKTMEVFMDDFLVFGDSFDSCLSNLEKMLKWCEDTNLVLNWEKCHFMCREGIVLGHKISKSGIEVDRAKVDVIAKLPHPTTVKGVRSFLGHAGFYRRFIQDFSKIARPMTHLLEKETPFVFSKDCIDAFQTLKKKLTEAPILVIPGFGTSFRTQVCESVSTRLGVVLGQRKMKHFQPIHYASKTMTEAQIHYTTTKHVIDGQRAQLGENSASWSDKLDDALCALSVTAVYAFIIAASVNGAAWLQQSGFIHNSNILRCLLGIDTLYAKNRVSYIPDRLLVTVKLNGWRKSLPVDRGIVGSSLMGFIVKNMVVLALMKP